MALCVAIAIAIAYHFAVVTFKIQPGITETTFKWNIATIENYEFGDTPIKVAVLGSSMLNRVMTKTEMPGLENLCIRGYCALDGLALIRHRKRYPKLVVIEPIYLLQTRKRYNLTAEVPDYKIWLAKFTPLAISLYQPYAIFMGMLKEEDKKRRSLETKPVSKTASSIDSKGPLPKFHEPPKMNREDRLLINGDLETFKAGIADLEKNGSRVCFVMVPISREYANSARIREQLTDFQKAFPESKYKWIKWSGPEREWNTVDGIHLTDADAALFSQALVEQIGLLEASDSNN